jgi:acetylornithine deacetylase/succinyl-diaminopimelate desuccinylase-like protein
MSTSSREPTASLATFSEIFESEQARFIGEWSEYLRFKSISTDPAFNVDCRKTAEWLVGHLTKIGFSARLLETPSKPTVFAEFKGKPNATRVLYYGHYDVQPVDPLSDWVSEPFTPQVRDGRLYARGAQDNKGQTFYVLKALETLIARGELNSSVTLLLEGEEECGSEGFGHALSGWKDLVQADVLMVCDTGALVPGVPFVTMGLRGLVSLEISLGGIHHDLHSGALGGVVKNPATELARLITTLHKPDGSIAVPGYYDEVEEFSAEDKTLANRSWPPEEVITTMLGVPPLGGEVAYSAPERRGFRPTIEVNGMYSGYQGPGGKTIIPATATAKLTSRLVARQNPERCLQLILDHLKKHAPKGLEFKVVASHVGGPALALSSSDPLVQRARAILDTLSPAPTQFTWEGGSIPIVAELAKVSGAKPLLVGFGLEEDKIHAPNESFAISQFKLGFLYACLMLRDFSEGS